MGAKITLSLKFWKTHRISKASHFCLPHNDRIAFRWLSIFVTGLMSDRICVRTAEKPALWWIRLGVGGCSEDAVPKLLTHSSDAIFL